MSIFDNPENSAPLTPLERVKQNLELDLMRANLEIKELSRLLNEEKIKCGKRGHDLQKMRLKLSGKLAKH
jgi:flagellar motor switch/type III secretory pathway protein FliN